MKIINHPKVGILKALVGKTPEDRLTLKDACKIGKIISKWDKNDPRLPLINKAIGRLKGIYRNPTNLMIADEIERCMKKKKLKRIK